MDTVIRQLTMEYCAQLGLESWQLTDQFEVFATYCVLNEHTFEPFNAADFRIGGSADGGIDGYAVALNGVLFRCPEALERSVASSSNITPTVVILQAKTSAKMDRKFISDLRVRVENILLTDIALDNAADAEPLRECLRVIRKHMGRLSSQGVRLVVAYASTSPKVNDEIRREAARAAESLKATGIVDEVAFKCLGRDELSRLHERAQWTSGAELRFTDRYALPRDTAGVSQALHGVVPARQLVEVLRGDNGDLNPALFSENIREFQPTASVNDEIRTTLRDESRRRRFAVLNNGITIVARFVRVWRGAVAMREFQVVNGCQTCHVLAREQHLLEGVTVKVQIIECEDDEVINDIVTATNRQTEIPKIYFTNRRNLLRRLEVYYRHQRSLGRPLDLGRKPGKGAIDLRNGVVGLNSQLRAHVAMFGRVPPTNRVADLDRDFERLFQRATEREFYIAAAALYRWEWLVEAKRIERVYRYLGFQAVAAVGVVFGVRATGGSDKDRLARLDRLENVVWSDGQWELLSVDIQDVLAESMSKIAAVDAKNAGGSQEFGETVVGLARRLDAR